MKILTKAFGEIEVSEKQKIFFPEGLFGFEDIKSFFILDLKESSSPFYWLQAESVAEIAFVIIEPKYVYQNYNLILDDKDIEFLKIENQDDILIFSIVTIYDNIENCSVNLLGPLVINKKLHIGKQVISNNENHLVRYPLITKNKED